MFRPLLPMIGRLHFYAGILIAPFLLVATISGGLYALAPTAEQIVYRQLLHTDSAGPPRSVAAQVASVRAAHPGTDITAIDVAADPGETTRVYLADPGLGESERQTVFVDPVSATVLGTSVTYGSNGALPLRTWISQLHRHLHLGEPGRLYSELAASWLWVVALGGLVLWINRFRTRRRNNGAPWWRLAALERRGTKRNRTLSWHGAVGVWLVVGLVFLSATGLTWSRHAGANIADMRSTLNWERPTMPSILPVAHHAEPGSTAPSGIDPSALDSRLDAVLSVARNQGLDGRVELALPTSPEAAITVSQVRQPWRFSVDAVAIDPHTLAVTAQLPFTQWSMPAKLTDWAIQLHMGILFGWASALALFALAMLLVTVIIRGYLMWWRRGPGPHPGSAPKRGNWLAAAAGASWPVRLAFAALALGVALIGWFIPLLGIGLVAFLTVDIIVGQVASRRSTPTG